MIRWIKKIIKRKDSNIGETIDLMVEQNKIYNKLTNIDRKVNVSEWITSQKASGVPLNEIMEQLMKKCQFPEESGKIKEMELLAAKIGEYMDAANKIQHTFVSRNLDRIQFERDGEDNKAIQLYEDNIQDRFVGSHPYERLRIISTIMKRHKDVVRVCQSYIDNGQHDPQLKAKYEGIIIILNESIDND